MPITLKGIDFLITYNCPAQCPHCVYRAGPSRGGHAQPEHVEAWLRQVSDHPLEWVMLFGGEPFIYFNDLLLMVQAVRRETHAEPSVFTNGYWAYDWDVARTRLARLRAAGLDHLCFSVDAFHGGFVPVGRVAIGIRTAKALGYGKITVDNQWVVAPDFDIPVNAATRRMMATLEELVDLDGVEITASHTHPTGRAAEHLPEVLRSIDKMPAGLCEAEGLCIAPYYLGEDLHAPNVVEVHPDGTVDLCSGIAIGNAHDTPLAQILARYDYTQHPIIQTLVTRGPVGLLEMAETLGYERLPGYVNACHLCYEVRAFLQAHEAGRELGLTPFCMYDRSR
jgi:hypothetical protein